MYFHVNPYPGSQFLAGVPHVLVITKVLYSSFKYFTIWEHSSHVRVYVYNDVLYNLTTSLLRLDVNNHCA